VEDAALAASVVSEARPGALEPGLVTKPAALRRRLGGADLRTCGLRPRVRLKRPVDTMSAASVVSEARPGALEPGLVTKAGRFKAPTRRCRPQDVRAPPARPSETTGRHDGSHSESAYLAGPLQLSPWFAPAYALCCEVLQP
jgi:hypothetical protein